MHAQLAGEAAAGGYHLNPDLPFTKALVRGLLVNKGRYGYVSCPCRLASGTRAEDTDIICPCDYRDPDLGQYGACYCALYVSPAVIAGTQKLAPVPERRPVVRDLRPQFRKAAGGPLQALPFPVWRCRVCGYLCARDEPPLVCPICKVSKDRFERFV